MVTYTGVLTGDRIEWTNGAKPPDGPVRVEVVQPAEPPPDERWLAGVSALSEIAARGNLDAAAWERWREQCENGEPEGRP